MYVRPLVILTKILVRFQNYNYLFDYIQQVFTPWFFVSTEIAASFFYLMIFKHKIIGHKMSS